MKSSLEKLYLSFIVPSHYTLMFQINVVTTPFSYSVKMLWLSLQTHHNSVNLLFNKATYHVPNPLCITASIKNSIYQNLLHHYQQCHSPSLFFPLEVAMATAVGSFCRLFFQVAALVHVSHYRYTASGKLSSTDVLSVSWASPRLPPCPIHWCILKNVMYVSNVRREGELAG